MFLGAGEVSISDPRPNDPLAAPEPATVRVSLSLTRPLWTYVLLGINILMWVAMTASGGSENLAVLVTFGAKVNTLIREGQYWRLFTANFVHIGLMHLVFNAYALFNLGAEVEKLLGHARFVSLYLLAGVGGVTLSYVGNPAIAAGASGAIFGLIGALMAYLLIYRKRFGERGRRQLRSIVTIAGINLVLGLSPGIDNLAHVGGLLVGLGLGWAYCPRYRLTMDPQKGPSLVEIIRPGWIALGSLIGVGIIALLLIFGPRLFG
jgi:rhomboid protease GluP